MNTVTFTATSPAGSSRTETVPVEDFAAKMQDYNNHGWTVVVAQPAAEVKKTKTAKTPRTKKAPKTMDAYEIWDEYYNCGSTIYFTPRAARLAAEEMNNTMRATDRYTVRYIPNGIDI